MANSGTTISERPASAVKLPCALCEKPIGIVRCEGCQKSFCPKDLIEHRNELAKQLDELTNEHDHFNDILNQVKDRTQIHALVQRVNVWEKEAKLKIKQVAEEMRRQIEVHNANNFNEISVRFREISERLIQARADSTFDERDMKRWKQQLEQINQSFLSPSSISLEEEPNEFIKKIQVKDIEAIGKKFSQVSGNAQLHDGGLSVLCNYNYGNSQGAQVRGLGEYSYGIHKIKIRLENYNNSCLFFGMNSKSTPMQNNSCNSPTTYGWLAGVNNTVYLCGTQNNQYQSYVSDYQVNDIVEVEADCYRRLIRIRNERSTRQHELWVDLDKCPFPWVFQFVLFAYGDRLRIVN